jgi:hypothetical protein
MDELNEIDVNSVKDGSGNPFLILGNDSRRIRTGFLSIIEIFAWAGLHTIGHIFRVR